MKAKKTRVECMCRTSPAVRGGNRATAPPKIFKNIFRG